MRSDGGRVKGQGDLAVSFFYLLMIKIVCRAEKCGSRVKKTGGQVTSCGGFGQNHLVYWGGKKSVFIFLSFVKVLNVSRLARCHILYVFASEIGNACVLEWLPSESHTRVHPTLKPESFSKIFWQLDRGRNFFSRHFVGLIGGNHLEDAPRAGSETLTPDTCDFPMFSCGCDACQVRWGGVKRLHSNSRRCSAVAVGGWWITTWQPELRVCRPRIRVIEPWWKVFDIWGAPLGMWMQEKKLCVWSFDISWSHVLSEKRRLPTLSFLGCGFLLPGSSSLYLFV